MKMSFLFGLFGWRETKRGGRQQSVKTFIRWDTGQASGKIGSLYRDGNEWSLGLDVRPWLTSLASSVNVNVSLWISSDSPDTSDQSPHTSHLTPHHISHCDKLKKYNIKCAELVPALGKKGKVLRADWAVWGADQISNLQESCKLISASAPPLPLSPHLVI